jgi:hypothetical protein
MRPQHNKRADCLRRLCRNFEFLLLAYDGADPCHRIRSPRFHLSGVALCAFLNQSRLLPAPLDDRRAAGFQNPKPLNDARRVIDFRATTSHTAITRKDADVGVTGDPVVHPPPQRRDAEWEKADRENINQSLRNLEPLTNQQTMSHFSTLKTKITDERYLLQALRDLGYNPVSGKLSVRGYAGSRTDVDIRIASKTSGYDIGFRKQGEHYACVADWFGVRGINQRDFLESLTQRYASLIVKDQLIAQGFSLAEERQVEGRIHLLLRRSG